MDGQKKRMDLSGAFFRSSQEQAGHLKDMSSKILWEMIPQIQPGAP